jgi:hypothetical protein
MSRVAWAFAVTAALCAGSLACPSKSCTDALWYASRPLPDAAQGAACTLTVSAGDASMQVNISAENGSGNVPCSSPSLPAGSLFCVWGSGLLYVETVDESAGHLVNHVLGDPSDRDASAALICNGQPVPGASTQALLHLCGI